MTNKKKEERNKKKTKKTKIKIIRKELNSFLW